MDSLECLECNRLREVYRSATRHELDLTMICDQAAMRNEPERLEELRAELAQAAIVRAMASKSVLIHEDSHPGAAVAAAT